jgi:putative hydrolase of the HAD superfamily
MFEAVIFDFGGVITHSPFEAFNRLEARLSIPADTIRRINASNPDHNAWARFERAEIDAEAFDTAFASEAKSVGVELAGREVLSCLQGSVRLDMLEALRRISGTYKTGCITNNVKSGKGVEAKPDPLVIEAFSLFDHVLESSKIGIRKPDPRIYELMLSKLKVKPERCIYLDDLGINLKPARDLGMTTIKVTSSEPTIAELERLLRIELR